jgi:transposase-like protein
MACPNCQSTATTRRSKKTQLGYRTFCCPACKRTFNERTGMPYNYLRRGHKSKGRVAA